MSSDYRLAAFLYLIMRDTLPVGIISRKINEIDESIPTDSDNHNETLQALALEFANRILKE